MDTKSAEGREEGQACRSRSGVDANRQTQVVGGPAATAASSTLGSEISLINAPKKKQFGILTITSLAFVICNSWAGISGSLQLALLAGGPVTLVYGVLISSIVYICIALSLAELASVYPTAGGQYHFTSILAPDSINRGISYACGLVSLLSWIAIGSSVTLIPAQQIPALVATYSPSFVQHSWHVFLIYEGVALVVLAYNLFALKRTPWVHEIGCKSVHVLNRGYQY